MGCERLPVEFWTPEPKVGVESDVAGLATVQRLSETPIASLSEQVCGCHASRLREHVCRIAKIGTRQFIATFWMNG